MLSSNGVKRSWRRMRRNRKDHRKYPYAIYRELTLWNPPSEYNERYIYQILGQRLASKYKSCLKFIYFLQFFSNIVEWAFSKQCCLLQIVRILIVVNFYKRKWWWNPVLRQVKMCADVFAGHANMLSLDSNFMHCVWEQNVLQEPAADSEKLLEGNEKELHEYRLVIDSGGRQLFQDGIITGLTDWLLLQLDIHVGHTLRGHPLRDRQT